MKKKLLEKNIMVVIREFKNGIPSQGFPGVWIIMTKMIDITLITSSVRFLEDIVLLSFLINFAVLNFVCA